MPTTYGTNIHSGKEYARALFASMHTTTVIPLGLILDKSGLPSTKVGEVAFTAALLAGVNGVVSAVQAVSPWLEALVAEAMFIAGKAWYYKFLLNPQNVNFTLTKLQSVEETSDLAIINTYRNAISTMAFKGISGCTLPRDFMDISVGGVKQSNELPINTFARYPKLSASWFKFMQLEKFYTETNSDVLIMYDMDMYVGKLVNLNYSFDANNPWVINYDMQFKLYPGLMLRSLSSYTYRPFFEALTNRYGQAFAKNFEGM